MDSLRRLEEIFARFPGIGPRQARRFVYYILSKPPEFTGELSNLIEKVKKAAAECRKCRRLFVEQGRKNIVCAVCSDQNRDQSVVMIVARDSDFESIEKSRAYKGLYFILGGIVPILDKEPEKRIGLKALLDRIAGDSNITEIILSLNATPDGEHTALIIKEAMGRILKGKKMKVTLLGRGLSTGAELEYLDEETIRNALQNRS